MLGSRTQFGLLLCIFLISGSISAQNQPSNPNNNSSQLVINRNVNVPESRTNVQPSKQQLSPPPLSFFDKHVKGINALVESAAATALVKVLPEIHMDRPKRLPEFGIPGFIVGIYAKLHSIEGAIQYLIEKYNPLKKNDKETDSKHE